MSLDASGYMRPGSDPRDGDLDGRERQALCNENSGTEARRVEVIARRGGANVIKARKVRS